MSLRSGTPSAIRAILRDRFLWAVAGMVVIAVVGIWGVQVARAWPGWYDQVCDASVPQWMLDAQGGTDSVAGGCPHVMPSELAPADADWTMVCTGLC